MIRKMLFGAVAAVGIGFCGQEASAAPPAFAPPGGPYAPGGPFVPGGGFRPPQHRDYDYVVYVARRHGNHIHWERYGRYETRWEAQRVEWMLERRGFRTRIEEVRDRDRRY